MLTFENVKMWNCATMAMAIDEVWSNFRRDLLQTTTSTQTGMWEWWWLERWWWWRSVDGDEDVDDDVDENDDDDKDDKDTCNRRRHLQKQLQSPWSAPFMITDQVLFFSCLHHHPNSSHRHNPQTKNNNNHDHFHLLGRDVDDRCAEVDFWIVFYARQDEENTW